MDKCEIRLLEDIPVEEDKLGALQTIVDSIVAVIENNKGGKSILLEGIWGSGKSSVIKLLQKRYRDDRNVAIVIFDAWGHQGDPLRRSFLESLICCLKEKKTNQWHDIQDWQKELDLLIKRYEQTQTKKTTRLTWTATLIAIFSLLVPLASVLVNKGCSIGYFLYLLPFIPFIVRLIKYRSQKKQIGTQNRFRDIFIREESEEINSESYKTTDPTSIEFCELFNKTVSDALGKNSQRKLIIVVENLDRVAKNDALLLWSTMRTIFEVGSKQRPSWLDRIWLIVPVDYSAAEKLWEESRPDSNHDPNAQNIGEHFLDKTFQIRFHIPPLVLTAWEDFLRAKLIEALPNHRNEKEEIQPIIRLFDLLHPKANSIVTPRDIIKFVNRVATVHQRWLHTIPLRVQATYALIERNIRDKGINFLTGSQLNPAAESILSYNEWQRDLARIHFNIDDPTRVSQIVLAPEVTSALEHADTAKLDPLKTFPGFSEVVASVIVKKSIQWSERDGRTIANVSRALQHLDSDSSPEYHAAWSALGAQAPNKWHEFKEDDAQGIIAILSHNKNLNLIIGMVNSFANCQNIHAVRADTEESSPLDNLASNWTKVTFAVIKFLVDNGFEEVLTQHFRVSGSTEFYFRVLSALDSISNAAEFAKYYIIQDIYRDAVINDLAQEKMYKHKHAAAVQMMLKMPIEWQWNKVIENTSTVLNSNIRSLSPETIDACIAILFALEFKGIESAKTNLTNLVTTGRMDTYLPLLKQRNRFSAAARCAYIMFKYLPVTQPIPDAFSQLCSNPEQNIEITEALARLIGDNMPLGDFLNRVSQLRNTEMNIYPIAKFILLKTAETSLDYFNSNVVINDIDSIAEILGNEFDELIKNLVLRTDLISVVISERFEQNRAKFYLSLLNAFNEQCPDDFAEFLKTGLRNISKETWKSQLQKPGDLLQLVIAAVRKNINLGLGNALRDAMEEHAENLLKTGASPSNRINDWNFLTDALENSHRNLFSEFLARMFREPQRHQGLSIVLSMYESALIKSPQVLQRYINDIVTHFENQNNFRQMQENDWKWLAEILNPERVIINHCSPELLRALSERIEKTKISDNRRHALDTILKHIGHFLPQKNET